MQKTLRLRQKQPSQSPKLRTAPKTKSKSSKGTTSRRRIHSKPIRQLSSPQFINTTLPSFSSPIKPTSFRKMSTEQPKSSIYNKAIVLKPVGEHKRTVFFLHGLGDEGASFVDVFQMLQLKNTKVILPNAPRIPISCNNGYVMPGWYDITALGADRELGLNEDVDGINLTIGQMEIAINYEASLVGGHENILVGGFSQGSAVAQLVATKLDKKLAGVVALSGYALLSSQPEEKNPINTKDTPYFIYHGKEDEVVGIDSARDSKAYWEKRGLTNIEYSEEPGLGHSLSRDEIIKVKGFMTKVGFV